MWLLMQVYGGSLTTRRSQLETAGEVYDSTSLWEQLNAVTRRQLQLILTRQISLSAAVSSAVPTAAV